MQTQQPWEQERGRAQACFVCLVSCSGASGTSRSQLPHLGFVCLISSLKEPTVGGGGRDTDLAFLRRGPIHEL